MQSWLPPLLSHRHRQGTGPGCERVGSGGKGLGLSPPLMKAASLQAAQTPRKPTPSCPTHQVVLLLVLQGSVQSGTGRAVACVEAEGREQFTIFSL